MTKINMLGLLDIKGQENVRRVYGIDGISPCLTTTQGGNRQPKILVGGDEMKVFAERGRYNENGMRTLKNNDLFCGAGGMGIGFKQAGFETAGAWDFDKFAVQAYAHNVDPIVKQSDITQMNWADMPIADVWTFGFPCQDLSNAGKKAGMKLECKSCGEIWDIDPREHADNLICCPKCESSDYKAASRSGLFFEVMRLLDETIENDIDRLPPVIMAENVKGLKPYLEVLEDEYKQRGYKMYYTLYNSKFWGVAQNRERYFVVGVHESIEKEFEFPIQQENYIPRLSTFLDSVVDEKYYIDDLKALKIIEQAQEGLRVRQATKKGYDVAAVGDAINVNQPNSKTRRGRVGKQVIQTLTTHQEHVVVESEFRVRKLTPREYLRLQGFSESFEIVVSDSQTYKQAGNAVTVNVARAIAERIKMFLLSL